MEFDLIQMLKCYEKTYGRYFTDSGNEWKQLDKVRKLEIDSQREIRRLIKEWDEKEREQRSMKIIDPRLVNQNSLLSNNEEFIQQTEFHNNLKDEVLPKRYFENKSDDFIRSDLLNLIMTNQTTVLVLLIVIIIIMIIK
jgi:hypothetical protein